MKNYLHQYFSNWEIPSFNEIIENSRFFKNHINNDYLSRFNEFKNNVIVITGASSGIGRSMAIEFSKRGAKVVLASRNTEKLEEVGYIINKEGGESLIIATDVSKERQCKLLIKKTINAFGKIDILINNAGISMRANFQEVRLDVLKKLMDINFWGSVYCTKYALPYLTESKGSIVGVSSICGITPLPGRTGYAASKHALDGFLETIRVENIEKGLHVLIVHPGFTTSNIRNTALNQFGIPQIETPKDESKLMPAERVAKEIADAIFHKKREITLTTEGRLITWLYKRAPNLADRLIFNEMKKEVGAPF
ncbi:SDR family oxidoreductase [Bacteroidota bacterium]